jgi:hypothetical protein
VNANSVYAAVHMHMRKSCREQSKSMTATNCTVSSLKKARSAFEYCNKDTIVKLCGSCLNLNDGTERCGGWMIRVQELS